MSDVISAAKCLTTGSLGETKPRFIVLLISVVLISPLWPISRHQHDITEFRDEKRFTQSALTSWCEPAPAHHWIIPALMDLKSDTFASHLAKLLRVTWQREEIAAQQTACLLYAGIKQYAEVVAVEMKQKCA